MGESNNVDGGTYYALRNPFPFWLLMFGVTGMALAHIAYAFVMSDSGVDPDFFILGPPVYIVAWLSVFHLLGRLIARRGIWVYDDHFVLPKTLPFTNTTRLFFRDVKLHKPRWGLVKMEIMTGGKRKVWALALPKSHQEFLAHFRSKGAASTRNVGQLE